MWWTEYSCNPTVENQFNRAGSIELQDDCPVLKKPLLLVASKLLLVVVATVFVVTFAVQSFPQVGLRAGLLTLMALIAYFVTAFFVRPKPNTDNLGVLGGLADDPFQYNDDINRLLWKLDVLLGPGRFAVQSLLDTAVWVGVIPERTEEDIELEKQLRKKAQREATYAHRLADAERRTHARWEEGPGGEVELDTAKYLQQADEPQLEANEEDEDQL